MKILYRHRWKHAAEPMAERIERVCWVNHMTIWRGQSSGRLYAHNPQRDSWFVAQREIGQ
jgi:hypothetical protein